MQSIRLLLLGAAVRVMNGSGVSLIELAERLRWYLAPKVYESHPKSDEDQEATSFDVVADRDRIIIDIDAKIGPREYRFELVLDGASLPLEGSEVDWLAKGIALDIDEVFNAGEGVPLEPVLGRRRLPLL